MVWACNIKRKYNKDKGSSNPNEKRPRGSPKKCWKDKMNNVH